MMRFLGRFKSMFLVFPTNVPSAGLWSSAPIIIGGGVITDLFAPKERASSMAIFTLAPVLGVYASPILVLLDLTNCR